MSTTNTFTFGQLIGIPADGLAQRLADVLKAENAHTVSEALAQYNGRVSAWLADAAHDRDLGLSIRPKPAQPTAPMMSFSVSGDAASAVLTVVTDIATLGDPCPDLPPLNAGAKFSLGDPVGGGWFLAKSDDTIASGATVNAPDGHVYVKYLMFNGLPMYYRKS